MDYHLPTPTLAQQGVTHIPRSQNRPAYSRPTRHTTLHLKLRVRAELERKAREEGLSVSATGAAILEWFFEQSITTQHAATLERAIETSIGKHMRSYSTRLAVLLVRVAFSSEQTRSLVTNILARQQGVTPTVLNHILDGSSNAAKRNITRKTPQLESIIEEFEQWFRERGSETPV
jgi:hypothetical protein